MERKWLILSTVSLGSLMATLDGSIVNIALPAMQSDFRIDLTSIEWVVVAYLLVVGSLLLPVGRLGEVLTFKRVYLVGFAVFTLASVCCGASPNAAGLVAFRVVQAVGAAMIMAMGPAIVARTFPANERGRALGLNGVSVSIGLSLGPALGGILTQAATWRAIFLINAPIGLLAIVWAARVLPAETRGKGQAFDLTGAALSGGAVFALLLALSEGQQWGWTSPAVAALFAVFAVLGVLFIRAERRALQPMIDLALFRIRAFSAGLASVVVAFAGLFTATFLLPFLLQQGRGFSPIEAGLLLTPVPIAMALVGPFSGAASDRFGPRVLASAGMAVMVLGLLSLAYLPFDFALPDLVWRLALLGVGQGLFMSPNSSAVLGSVPRPRVGTASGTLAQMRVNGQALGIAISGAIYATRLPVHLAALKGSVPGPSLYSEAQTGAIHDAFVVAALVCCLGIVTSLGSRLRLRQPHINHPTARLEHMSISRLHGIDPGRIGVFAGPLNSLPAAVQREFVREMERLGYGTLWYGESLAQEAFGRGAIYLAATERLVVASGIANIWARDAAAMINGGRTLAEAWPGRFILGIGVSHAPSVQQRGHEYERPYSAMRDYLDEMDAATWRGPEVGRPPLVLAALGPKMVALYGDRTAGAYPYFSTADHIREVRGILGPEPFIAADLPVVLAGNFAAAREIGDRHLDYYLGSANYRNNLLRIGWTEADLQKPGSDAVFEAIVAWGDLDRIGEKVEERFDAGADQVVLNIVAADRSGLPLAELRVLAPLTGK